MTSDDKFWITIWAIAATALLGLVAGITHYNLATNELWANNLASAIAKGVDPMQAQCAITRDTTSNVCVIIAARPPK